MMEYLSNRWLFKKHYILHDWSGRESNPSWIIGSGFHKVMEMYLSGLSIDKAIEKGYELLEQESGKVDWAKYKTITLEKCREQMAQAVKFYMEEQVDMGEILATEKEILTPIHIGSIQAPIPIKTVIDVISQKDNDLHIWDYKTVDRFTDFDSEQGTYILQSMFYYHAVKEVYRQPKAFHIIEIKKTENRDKSRQVQIYEIEYDKHPEYQVYFGKLYSGLILELSGNGIQFLPNMRDMFNSSETWSDFTAETMDFELPTRVSHRSNLTANVDASTFEKKFVPSKEPSTPEEAIISKLLEFGITLDYKGSYSGANVTMYTYSPGRGIPMNKIKGKEEDLMIALGSESVRIEAPIAGTKLVGIEVSNKERVRIDWTQDLLLKNTLAIPIGRDVYGKDIILDLAKAPHMLVAGTTGSGKSVFLASSIRSLFEQNPPEELGLVLIDPKLTEFSAFGNLPHLVDNTIETEVDSIDLLLLGMIDIMNSRYKEMSKIGVRNISDYNKDGGKMKKYVIVIDELADLLMDKSTPNQIESSIIRLAQKARAAGIHIIAATQRPSVNVVTGIMKANFPTRVAFRTASAVDSKVILDSEGAERLMNDGDLLLLDPRQKNIQRLQGYFI